MKNFFALVAGEAGNLDDRPNLCSHAENSPAADRDALVQILRFIMEKSRYSPPGLIEVPLEPLLVAPAGRLEANCYRPAITGPCGSSYSLCRYRSRRGRKILEWCSQT